MKRGRPISSKDKNPRKGKRSESENVNKENDSDETLNNKTSHEKLEVNDINKEMYINYGHTHILWNQDEMGSIDETFSYSVASDIMSEDDVPEPKSVNDCQRRHDWIIGKMLCKLN